MPCFTKFMQILEWAVWSAPPEQMNCSLSFQCIIQTIKELIPAIESAQLSDEKLDSYRIQELLDKAIRLYLLTPALVNVLLNYKICVEHDLPLHPTVYYELKEARKYRIRHSLAEIQQANEQYWQSIEVARLCYQCAPQAISAIDELCFGIPSGIASFLYTAVQDHYTWLGSQPSLLLELAERISREFRPSLIVAAAHGSIMPALILSELLEIPVYFIRFSMFKRHDEEPIISLSDQAWLFDYRNKNVLLYDEDVARGNTLDLFSRRLSPLFGEVRTACSIRHAGSCVHADFSGRVWWD